MSQSSCNVIVTSALQKARVAASSENSIVVKIEKARELAQRRAVVLYVHTGAEPVEKQRPLQANAQRGILVSGAPQPTQ